MAASSVPVKNWDATVERCFSPKLDSILKSQMVTTLSVNKR